MPFPECGAMSQGYIGYHLQQAIRQEMRRNGIHREVVSLITQVVVDPQDPAFARPSKPIGRFYSRRKPCGSSRNAALPLWRMPAGDTAGLSRPRRPSAS